jgi:threonyl-tRNA synthetase
MPERFELEYIGQDGAKHRPVMVHRTVFGSIERFIGVLIEHFAGAFPLWLSPVQVRVLPISEKHHDYARQVTEALQATGIRAEADYRAEKIGFKIRESTLQHDPYALVLGEKEAEAGNISVRGRKTGDEGATGLDAFIARVKQEIADKVLE